MRWRAAECRGRGGGEAENQVGQPRHPSRAHDMHLTVRGDDRHNIREQVLLSARGERRAEQNLLEVWPNLTEQQHRPRRLLHGSHTLSRRRGGGGRQRPERCGEQAPSKLGGRTSDRTADGSKQAADQRAQGSLSLAPRQVRQGAAICPDEERIGARRPAPTAQLRAEASEDASGVQPRAIPACRAQRPRPQRQRDLGSALL
mmetsp:Transcript_53203/g.171612  ORF Transcript_53203/g.171612 Transcript_53203/m.171612 type:complete len:202 (+) Transcript_53203:835-1440(+)